MALKLISNVEHSEANHVPTSDEHPADRGSIILRKVGILPQHYTASQP